MPQNLAISRSPKNSTKAIKSLWTNVKAVYRGVRLKMEGPSGMACPLLMFKAWPWSMVETFAGYKSSPTAF